ncbi:MAG: hypothetical protein KA210_05410 [Bacteroidia bacterium]|nr:hypothetical protein [Bacteroidia bacterium]
MNKQIHILIIILAIGFCMLPDSIYACGTKSEKLCCKQETASKTEKKDCCKNKQSKNQNNSCEGKCGHSNCTSSSVSFSIISTYEINFKNNSLVFLEEKSKFYHSKTFISSDYSSVWLPPKII